MKIRTGFVSNSSSSSYIVMFPDNFKIEDFNFEKYKEKINEVFNDWDLDSYSKEQYQAEIERLILGLASDTEYIYQDGADWQFELLSEILEDYTIAMIDSSSDCGAIQGVNKDKMKKILGE